MFKDFLFDLAFFMPKIISKGGYFDLTYFDSRNINVYCNNQKMLKEKVLIALAFFMLKIIRKGKV